jgi:hypothetical protein
MRGFRLERSRDRNGEIDHVLGYFLVGPDGHPMVEYSQQIDPSKPARDAEEAAASTTTLIGAHKRRSAVIAWRPKLG